MYLINGIHFYLNSIISETFFLSQGIDITNTIINDLGSKLWKPIVNMYYN